MVTHGLMTLHNSISTLTEKFWAEEIAIATLFIVLNTSRNALCLVKFAASSYDSCLAHIWDK